MQFISGEEIERESFRIIDREAGDHDFSSLEWPVLRRMIHACADFSIMPLVRFSGNPVEKGIKAIKQGSAIITDINMVKCGISLARLSAVNPVYKSGRVFCNIADPKVARESRKAGLPRSIFNIRSLKDKVDGGIVCIGNAPTALAELCRLVSEEGVSPALVIAMPVGFVNVVESKELVKGLDIPYIVMEGRRGGTTFAVSVLNAISVLAGKH
ncbi:MAG: precorrin-8X methylmutase [bacterium]